MAEESAADRIKMSIGNAIKEKLTETIQNVDVLSMLQKIVAMTSEDEESEEVRGKLEGILEQYDGMSENEKLQFVAQLKEALATRLSMKFQEQDVDISGIQEAIGYAIVSKFVILAGVALVFIIIVVFFGYKLYKSITDKQKKREEKKKAKQMKKKK